MAGESLDIAIAGGGIGGLATAGFLARNGHRVTVFERASELREVGAGLLVAPNAMRLLRRLGVAEIVEERGVRLEAGWEFRRWQDGTVLSVEDMDKRCIDLYGEHTYTLHRADLLAAVASSVPEGSVRTGNVVVRAEQDADGAFLHLESGEIHRADIVIGADGVHSAVRGAVTEPSPADFSGVSAFRALVPAVAAPDFARRPVHTLWLGPDHHLVHYPISNGRWINLVAFAPAGDFTLESWSTTAALSELQTEFAGWDPRLQGLIGAASQPGRWALLDRKPLTQWADGRIALLGDSAHPMFPFFGQGAAQAIEDGAVLAKCLSGGLDPAAALQKYQEIRIPRTRKLQIVSHDRKEVNHRPDGPEQVTRDAELRGKDALLHSEWIYAYDPDAEGSPEQLGTDFALADHPRR
ncbi:FAD-dependent monooxygenase [Paenarthrobacter sp. NPDC091669]|uniref:FAD-dependent monooxygenase n=1 Tax=Paenarthrobacter sp. NPDC091669 TaxID=3364384 RepID=UPI0038141D6F